MQVKTMLWQAGRQAGRQGLPYLCYPNSNCLKKTEILFIMGALSFCPLISIYSMIFAAQARKCIGE